MAAEGGVTPEAVSQLFMGLVMVIIASGAFGLSLLVIKRWLVGIETRVRQEVGKIQGDVEAWKKEHKEDAVEWRKEHRDDHDGIMETIQMIHKRQVDCREELPTRYAPMEEVRNLWKKSDRLSKDISYLQGHKNGCGGG